MLKDGTLSDSYIWYMILKHLAKEQKINCSSNEKKEETKIKFVCLYLILFEKKKNFTLIKKKNEKKK